MYGGTLKSHDKVYISTTHALTAEGFPLPMLPTRKNLAIFISNMLSFDLGDGRVCHLA